MRSKEPGQDCCDNGDQSCGSLGAAGLFETELGEH